MGGGSSLELTSGVHYSEGSSVLASTEFDFFPNLGRYVLDFGWGGGGFTCSKLLLEAGLSPSGSDKLDLFCERWSLLLEQETNLLLH
ncbi:hypothetical protein Tco_1112667 [Tanacetum coccineum]|uniref:Methyltransferase n=1 Tax=Tanacetum coccineum TaxID=301880 RepID=A0ABQ5IQ91_9ASTR